MIPTTTLTRYVALQTRKHPGASGELGDLLQAIVYGVKVIRKLVASAGLRGLLGYTGQINVQGEETAILDEEADQVLGEALGSSGHFALLLSEERAGVISTTEVVAGAKYVVAFDPLDGSSNIGSNIPVGTIFAVFRKRDPSQRADGGDFLQAGRKLVAAGYAVYGGKTTLVYSAGDGVHEFTLDPDIGEFILTADQIRIPECGKIYSVNEGNSAKWFPATSTFVEHLKFRTDEKYTGRYVGSLVADFDRNLKKGGVYIYPVDRANPNGKLRMLYECMPLAFIVEQAGGMAIDGTRDILDIVPDHVHMRSGFIVGSPREVSLYRKTALQSGVD